MGACLGCPLCRLIIVGPAVNGILKITVDGSCVFCGCSCCSGCSLSSSPGGNRCRSGVCVSLCCDSALQLIQGCDNGRYWGRSLGKYWVGGGLLGDQLSQLVLFRCHCSRDRWQGPFPHLEARLVRTGVSSCAADRVSQRGVSYVRLLIAFLLLDRLFALLT